MTEWIFTLIFLINGILLGIAAWHDFKYRSVSLGLLIAINVLPFLFFIQHFNWIFDKTAWQIIYFFLFSFVAAIVRFIGAADAFVIAAISFLLLCTETTMRSQLLIIFITGTGIAVFSWYILRFIKSWKISGTPKNIWDFMALKMGRLEKEPELKKYLHNEKNAKNFDWIISHIEAFRTPDSYHLYPDSCPLITCLFVGYFGIAGMAFL